MKKFLLFGIFPLIFCATFGSCKNQTQDTDSSPTLFADFYVRYLHDEKLTKAEVSFREGSSDSTAVSKDFEEVIFFGRPMEAIDLGPERGIRFSIEFPENYPGTYIFEFGDQKDSKKKFSMEMGPLSGFGFEGPLSKSKGANLKLEGPVPGKGESLILLFSNEKNQTGVVEIPKIDGRTSFQLRPEALISLSPGKNRVYLVKKKLEYSQANKMNTSALIEYYSSVREVEVLD